MSSKSARIVSVLKRVKELAVEYYKLTNKPLGITGEIAEAEAADKLGLELCAARNDGYDAIRHLAQGKTRIQIKGRRILSGSNASQRLGGIKLNKEWDSVVCVLLDDNYLAIEMYEAERNDVERELLKPGSRARNERGALSISKFKQISKRVWFYKGSADQCQ